MKASVGAAPSSAARRLAMSFCTAVRSFQSMGPLHAGRVIVEPAARRGPPPRGSPPSRPASRHRALAVEAGEPMAHVGRVADLALLAVADDVHARVHLLAHDVADGATHAGLEGGRVGAGAGVQRVQHPGQVGRPGQAAGVRGEDAVGASLHGGERNLTPLATDCQECSLLDHLIRPLQERLRDRQPERLRRLEVDHQLERGRLLDGQIGRSGALQDLVDVGRGPAPQSRRRSRCTS